MKLKYKYCCCNHNSDIFGGNKSPLTDIEDVPQRDKREVVLGFLREHEIPLRPKAIYGGLIYQQDITFTYRTVQNILSELNEGGFVRRVYIDDDEGKVVDIPESETGRRASYVITKSGKCHIDAC